jgi:hypothetical protein
MKHKKAMKYQGAHEEQSTRKNKALKNIGPMKRKGAAKQ